MSDEVIELFDDDDEPVHGGDTVRVNGEFEAILRVNPGGKFQVEGWPEDCVVHSLELIKPATAKQN